MDEVKGWLLDLYEEPDGGIRLWLLAEDGRRLELRQAFGARFYASGEPARLALLESWLKQHPVRVETSYDKRYDLLAGKYIPALVMTVQQVSEQPKLFRWMTRFFGDLTYYDADLPVAVRHAAVYNTFPLAYCHLVLEQNRINRLQVLDNPWKLDTELPKLRVLTLEPVCDPQHGLPEALRASWEHFSCLLSLSPIRALLINLRGILRQFDPDLILTEWGDNWLLPWLLEQAESNHLALPLNRQRRRKVAFRKARSYFSYGQIVYRPQQMLLFGRWHIDRRSAMMWGDYGLEGILETARVTGLPVQTAARTSPGTGISTMQVLTALRLGILVPWHKQSPEHFKTALDLLRSDRGGLVYQPLVGLHENVGEIDFISMYPSIMVRQNISPETMQNGADRSKLPPGLIPQTLAPLLEKRIALKQRLESLPRWHPQYKLDKTRASAHKWLLVTCFGYLGYKNARFGRIEAHEAVTAGGREALLAAKEVAEEQDFLVIQMYVDGLWVQRPRTSRPEEFHDLLQEILERTGLAIALDGIYRWVAFLPSRMDQRVPVANRYFGVFQDGSIKVRGIEARRRDAAPFIAAAQMKWLECLAQGKTLEEARTYLPQALDYLMRLLRLLHRGAVAPEELLVSQRLGRKLESYRSFSPAARAALQLKEAGKVMRPGQRIRFIYTLGEPGVYAWDAPQPLDMRQIHWAYYRKLLLAAAEAIFGPFGFTPQQLWAWGGEQEALPPRLPFKETTFLPLKSRNWLESGLG
jgi:DNA polymerase-2